METKTFKLSLYFLVKAIIRELIKNHNYSYQAAIFEFYASKTYRKLENESTKYWWLSPLDLVDEFLEESKESHYV